MIQYTYYKVTDIVWDENLKGMPQIVSFTIPTRDGIDEDIIQDELELIYNNLPLDFNFTKVDGV